jgi:hypothetical protein
MTSAQLLSWLSDHAASLWPVVSALLVIVLRSRTPEAWVALGETSPRLQGVIRLLRAVGLDPAKALSALGQIVTGRAPARALQIADTVQRATQAPPPPSDPQRGAVRVGALLAICGASVVASVVGAVLTGCPKVIREPSLPPPADGCVAGATTCHEGAPWRCGPEGRWSQADRRCDRLSGADGGTAVLCCATPSALQPGALVHACVPANVCAPEVSP